MIQWFHYYFEALADLTRILHPLITGVSHPEITIAYRGIYVVYDILAFSIPHACGLRMNSYHQKYLNEQRKERLDTAEKEQGSKLQYAMAYLLQIEKDQDGDFVPGIPGTGIQIPLDSPGYILGILLTIFALVISFVNFS